MTDVVSGFLKGRFRLSRDSCASAKMNKAARRDVHFKEFKELGRSFQDLLKSVFFEQHEALTKFTKEYGVF